MIALETSSVQQIAVTYDRHRAELLRHLIRIVGDPATAEDLCHETFYKAMRAWATRRSDGETRAWLYRIATYTAYDYLRRKRFDGGTLDDDRPEAQTDDTDLACVDLRVPIEAALARLPAGDRALLLANAQGYSSAELAATLGVADVTARTRLHRARARLRQAYAE